MSRILADYVVPGLAFLGVALLAICSALDVEDRRRERRARRQSKEDTQ